jgi:hypothetical protein
MRFESMEESDHSPWRAAVSFLAVCLDLVYHFNFFGVEYMEMSEILLRENVISTRKRGSELF